MTDLADITKRHTKADIAAELRAIADYLDAHPITGDVSVTIHVHADNNVDYITAISALGHVSAGMVDGFPWAECRRFRSANFTVWAPKQARPLATTIPGDTP